jgi:hypothetical protein
VEESEGDVSYILIAQEPGRKEGIGLRSQTLTNESKRMGKVGGTRPLSAPQR